ncbi:MAG: TonB-dependent receptor [Flavobacteriales bacterium]|nr:TonB-dependent receptor [Flavobacteriales bacterium]
MISMAQNISGNVYDALTKQALPGATVKIKGTSVAASTDAAGYFTLPVSNFPITITINYLGYEDYSQKFNNQPSKNLSIYLEEKTVDVSEVEVISSRITEKEKESPITVESMGVKQIKEVSATTFYEGLGNMKGVDITAASLGFRVINTRGFNSTSPVRSLQLIDGVDNQSPGLNFSLGNFLGAGDLDVNKVDIISGASSAFYGPNAFNGVISMETKNPFLTPGLDFQTKIGERQLKEISFRLAQVIPPKSGKDKLAYKICLYSMSAYDWKATNYNPSSDSKMGKDNPGRYDAINIYGDENLAFGNDFTESVNKFELPGLGMYYRNGYKEEELVDYNTNNLKLNTAIHYKITPQSQLIYGFNLGSGTTVYQGDNRYSLKNIRFWQNRLEWSQKDKFFLRFYSTQEDAGDSYDAVFTALRLNDATYNLGEWYNQYRSNWVLLRYKRTVENLLGNQNYDFFRDSLSLDEWAKQIYDPFFEKNKDTLAKLHQQSLDFINTKSGASRLRYEPGTARFDSMFNVIRSKNFTEQGTRFYDKSALYHLQGEYVFTPKWAKVVTGFSSRLYRPDSKGTIFKDTAGNTITNYEYGIYAGIDKKTSDKHWKFNLTARLDKNQNFDFLLSPAASVMYIPSQKNSFRLTVSRAIRNPTLADQYLYYNVGRAILIGNLSGFDSLISIESFDDYRENLDVKAIRYLNVKPIEPERVLTFEFGYKSEIRKRLFLDFGYYYSIYSNFIGYNIGMVTKFDPVTRFPVGGIQVYRLAANSQDQVSTTGANFGFSYFFKKYSFTGNYSYNEIFLKKSDDPIVPAFNTPKNKFNLGLSGRELKLPFIGKNRFGFNFNYKWIEGFEFTGSPQFSGYIRTYDMFDAQINYFFPKYYLTLKVGGSNLFGIYPFFRDGEENPLKTAFDNRNTQVYGGPNVGRLAYISLLFEIPSAK